MAAMEEDVDSSVSSIEVDPNSVTPFEMGYKYYNRLWAWAQSELGDLILKEPPLDEPPEKIPDRLMLVRRASKMYLKYIKVTNKILQCFEHIAQPQKRLLLRKLGDSCIGRVLELKQDLVSLESSEFHFLDQMLLSMRMLPKDMDIRIPEYYKETACGDDNHKKTVEECLSNIPKVVDAKWVVTEKMKFVKTAMVYIRIIQAHERSRQAREDFREQQKKCVLKELNKKKEARKEVEVNMTRQSVSVVIQKAWRMRMLRNSVKKEYVTEMNFLGMLPKSRNILMDNVERDRVEIIKRNEEEFLQAKSVIKDRLSYNVPEMMEALEDEMRSYFHKFFELYGTYPEFPNEEDGGSKKMFEISVDIDTEQKEATEDDSKSESQKDSKSEKSSKSEKGGKDAKSEKGGKDAKGKDGKGKDAKGKDGKGKEVEEVTYSLTPSKFVPDLITLQEEYKNVWQGKEPENFDRFDYEMLKSDVLKEVELEVRKIVDDKMRIEVQRLTEAFQKDSKKKAKAKKGKGKKKGKDKKKKGKKGKKEKDLTPNRTPESLIEELVAEGIIKSYPKYKLNDFIGDYSYSGSLQHISGDPLHDPTPCLCDIRRVVNEYCILPMGSQYIHSNGAYVKSVLFAGPKGVGKKSLIYAACNEINATMMDLSAENIDDKYPNKEMLLHLVLKVGRLVQPTVIFINDAENYFYKKKPLTCTLADPGRLKKDLPKFVKGIRNEDRILICGTTVIPFDVDLKGLGGSYNKVICILKPDFNCRSSLWREMILKRRGILTKKLDMSVLCSVSDGFTAEAIQSSVAEALTERRIGCQKVIPIEAADFVPGLARHVPVYEEEMVAYAQWLEKMPQKKKRIALLETEREGQEEVEDVSDEED